MATNKPNSHPGYDENCAEYIFDIENDIKEQGGVNGVWFFNKGDYYCKNTGYNKNTSMKLDNIKLENLKEEVDKVRKIAVKVIRDIDTE